MRRLFTTLVLLGGCAASPAPDPRLDRHEERLSQLTGQLSELGGQLAALHQADRDASAERDRERRALESRLSELAAPPTTPSRPAWLQAAQNAEWPFRLLPTRTWVQVAQLVVELDLDRPAALVMAANGHALCEPTDGREPHPDQWITLSFFVGEENAPLRAGLRVFHDPELSWGQIHTHPSRSWQGLSTTQLARVPAGRTRVSLRAMQNDRDGRWRLHGMACYVLAIPE